ncbi:MAG: hypothetical protein IT260_22330 [Saprospiraceae bacterium]|nr:hypothetical protein [Saprospiraceae bacterium]
MTIHLKKLPLPAAALLLLVALFTCCTPDTKNCGPALSTENTVTVRMSAQVKTLNPLFTTSGYDGFVAAQVIPCLSVIDPQTLDLKPFIIKNIPKVRKVDSGPFAGTLAYDFEIYEDAVWDNGSPVTANDFVFSLKAILHPALPTGRFRGYLEYLRDVEIDAASPKKFTTYFNQFYILALETMVQLPIFPAYNYDPQNQLAGVTLKELLDINRANEILASNAGFAAWADAFQAPRFANDKTAISGCGAYRLENIDVDQGCILVKKQNWWGDKHVSENPSLGAFPEKLVYRFVKDEEPTESLLRSGKVDIVTEFLPEKFMQLKNDSCLHYSYDFKTSGSTSYNRIMVNNRNAKLTDKRVRQALAHVVDYNYLLNTLWQGMAQRITSPVHPAKPFYNRNIKPYEYDIQKAKDLLAAAGWTDTNGNGIADKNINGTQTELELELIFPTSKLSQKVAQSIATTARNAGIKINVSEKDISLFRELTSKTNYELAMVGSTLFPGLVELYQNFHTKSIGSDNRFNFSNAELDALIEQIRTEADDTKRNMLYEKAQVILYDELPEIYLYTPQQRAIVSRRFTYVLSANRPGYYEHYFRLIK